MFENRSIFSSPISELLRLERGQLGAVPRVHVVADALEVLRGVLHRDVDHVRLDREVGVDGLWGWG